MFVPVLEGLCGAVSSRVVLAQHQFVPLVLSADPSAAAVSISRLQLVCSVCATELCRAAAIGVRGKRVLQVQFRLPRWFCQGRAGAAAPVLLQGERRTSTWSISVLRHGVVGAERLRWVWKRVWDGGCVVIS